jgi:hypothetical protein
MHGQPRSIAKLADVRLQVENETERMLGLARTVGKRLRHHLMRTADARDLPDEEWRETAKWYSRCVIELKRFLASQPAKPDDEPSLSEADYEAEIAEIAREQFRKMTPSERREFLQKIEHEPAAVMLPASTLEPAPDRWHK